MRTAAESSSGQKRDAQLISREDFERRHDLRERLVASKRRKVENPQAENTQSQQTVTPELTAALDASKLPFRSDSVARNTVVGPLSAPPNTNGTPAQESVWSGPDAVLDTSEYLGDSEDIFTLFTTLNDDGDGTPTAANKVQPKPKVTKNQARHCDVCQPQFPSCQCAEIIDKIVDDGNDRWKAWVQNEEVKAPNPLNVDVPIADIMSDESMRRTWNTSDLQVQDATRMQREAVRIATAGKALESRRYSQQEKDRLRSVLPGKQRDLLRIVRSGRIQKDSEEVVFKKKDARIKTHREQEELEQRAFKPTADKNATLSQALTFDPKLLQEMDPDLPL